MENLVAVSNLASDVTPCNVHLTRMADKVKEGLWDAKSVPLCLEQSQLATGFLWVPKE